MNYLAKIEAETAINNKITEERRMSWPRKKPGPYYLDN